MKAKKLFKCFIIIIIIITLIIGGYFIINKYLNINNEDKKTNLNLTDTEKYFLNKNYNKKELVYINNLSDKNKDKLKNSEYINILNYYKIKNFNVDNYKRYEDYKIKNDLNYTDIVTQVNIGLDQEFYTNSSEITNPDDYLVIVNKYHYLPKSFIPKDLVILFDTHNNSKLVRTASDAYEQLISSAKKDNIILQSTTSYRSYDFQNILYTNYVRDDGKENADTYSARPGYSEHQTGLVVDLKDPTVIGRRLDEKDTAWLDNNAYQFGFIRRYKKDKINITGYMEEQWHIRYVGKEAAKIIQEENITLEEYVDLFITEY